MFEPKKQPRSQATEPVKRCANTNCNARLSLKKAKQGCNYCDRICRKEHERLLLQEQIHTQIVCENCDKGLDYSSRSPSDWERVEHHFCDKVCTHEWRLKNGHYKKASQLGNEAIRDYKEKHGKMHQYEERSKAISENNKKSSPKAKWHDRTGHAWGYEVRFQGTGKDYIVSVPEMPEIEEFHAGTMKAGLLEVRQRMLEMHAQERTQ